MAKIATTNQTKNGAGRRTATVNRVLDATVETQQLAYQFFVDRGFQHGFNQEDWARAEAIVKNRLKG